MELDYLSDFRIINVPRVFGENPLKCLQIPLIFSMGEIVDEDDSAFGIEKGQETIFGLARKGSEASSKRGASSRTGFVVECYVA
jgi:hypothetical protein